jgi:AcrR family transcriptional regulator
MSTRDEILAAAVTEVRQRDEAAFRVATVAKNAGCATSVLYHYFGSRDGLIDAALVEIVVQETEDLRTFVQIASEAVENSRDAIELLVTYAQYAHSPDRRANRSLRARLIGACQTRPAVREAFRSFGELVASINETMLIKLRDKGLLRTDIDVGALVLCLRALDYGWVLDDINDEPQVSFDAWLQLVRALATSLATEPGYLERASAD